MQNNDDLEFLKKFLFSNFAQEGPKIWFYRIIEKKVIISFRWSSCKTKVEIVSWFAGQTSWLVKFLYSGYCPLSANKF